MREEFTTSIAVGAALVALAGCGASAKALERSKPTPTTIGTTTTTTVAPTTTTTTARVVPAKWTDPVLRIDATALGAVKVGMTLADAERAAGVVFDGSGDGAHYPTKMPAGDAYGVVNAEDNGRVNCFGVGGDAGLQQTVVTPEGFRLGDSLAQLKSIYGARLVYMPEPPHGIEPREGYVVDTPGGRLVFIIDNGNVDSIVGGASGFDGEPLTPNTCVF